MTNVEKELFVAFVTTNEFPDDYIFYLIEAETPGNASRLIERELGENGRWHQISPIEKVLHED